MVERAMSLGVMAGSDVSAVRETLYAQQELLQKLHHDLDVERESSSTAASEALSMILRLQGEKAALEMEASQYKRMAEEKMCHAETSLAFFEDLIYQKEMEIASLEFQVQAYRCRLLSLGCTDPAVTENKFPDSLMLQTNDLYSGEASAGTHKIKRLQSLSPGPLDDINNESGPGQKPRLLLADKEVINESFDDKKDLENSPSPPGDLNSYWEQIKRIEERVHEISDPRDSQKENRHSSLRRGSMSRQLISQVSNTILESTKSDVNSMMEKMKNAERCTVKDASTPRDSPSSSSNVQDIFEVPQTVERTKIVSEKGEEKQTEESSNREETDFPKKAYQKMNHLERKSSKPPRDLSKKVEHRPRVTEFRVELQLMRERIERLEGGGIDNTGNDSNDMSEELGLLKQIHEQLNLMQFEMRSLRSTLRPSQPVSPDRRDDLPLQSIKEAMLYFWL